MSKNAKTIRFPLFLQYSREALGLSADEWFAVTLTIALGTDDTDIIRAAAVELGTLEVFDKCIIDLGGKTPAEVVRIVYDRAVAAGLASWNNAYPAEFGGVPTPFAKLPSNLLKRLERIEADSLDFSVLVLVAAYDYQLNHRRDFVKSDFRFSRKLASEATGASFEDIDETLAMLVEEGVLTASDGFYRLKGRMIHGARAVISIDGVEVGRFSEAVGVDFGFGVQRVTIPLKVVTDRYLGDND